MKTFTSAFDLMCIVDQIQHYAVHHHRPFVMKHLEAWHARHEKTLEPAKAALLEIGNAIAHMDMCNGEECSIASLGSADGSTRSDDFHGDVDVNDSESLVFNELSEYMCAESSEPAEWLRLKQEYKDARQQAANETRSRNQIRHMTDVLNTMEETDEAPRRRGRPPKARTANNETPHDGGNRLPKVGRPRGRPPKARTASTETPHDGGSSLPKLGRPRGRPRKAGVVKTEAPKRGRGRPRRTSTSTTASTLATTPGGQAVSSAPA